MNTIFLISKGENIMLLFKWCKKKDLHKIHDFFLSSKILSKLKLEVKFLASVNIIYQNLLANTTFSAET